ncbi:hypothetical protein MF406_01410 [Georgenia sp. TF02-10]|uniref:hypothetical protein n=1 Tax=Georgenia sp. TF02-10 TaxID=2917725 RepID=UPI001FA7FD64|nr:hypothetical protein [Georgenia sp. TF02-10]UNX54975.1 hypothetical protein MF406_01410 [Georgenia sp. TF02-10]
MSRKRKTSEIDAERLRRQAAEIGALVAEQATAAGRQAVHLAEQGKEWAAPHVGAATAWAAPRVDKAWRDTVKVAAPKVEAAADKVRPAVDNAYERVVEDYLPRVQKAMHDAAEAAAGETSGSAKADKAMKAARKALAEPPKKSHGVAKTVGWALVGTAAAGTGYLLWRRTQPVDDPWAEEYWEDTTVTSPAATTDTPLGGEKTGGIKDQAAGLKEKATGAASAAKAKATDAAKSVTEKAKSSGGDEGKGTTSPQGTSGAQGTGAQDTSSAQGTSGGADSGPAAGTSGPGTTGPGTQDATTPEQDQR